MSVPSEMGIKSPRKQEAGWAARFAKSEDRKATYREYLLSPEWGRKRAVVRRRAGSRCQVCNASEQIDVHHRTYERIGQEDLADLIVLCRNCHRLFHEGPPEPPARRRTRLCPVCGKRRTARKRCSKCKGRRRKADFVATQAAIEEELDWP